METANVNSGILNLNGQLTGVTDLNIADGGTLVSGGTDRINDTAVADITTGGTWTLNGDDTITTFNSGGLLNGNGTLTAVTYNLTNGAVTETLANLGSGTLNSDGNVTLNGDAAAETANVNSGILNLNGQLTGVTDLNIADGGTLVNGSGERINDTAVVDNSGALTLNGEETVTTYNSDGGLLNGTGLLTTTTYNLSNGAATTTGADLGTGLLNSGPGTVTLDGDTTADLININSGNLITNGAVQNTGGVITVSPDASWNANGNYTYATLQGNGTVEPGGLNGTAFRNENAISPGLGIGTLTIAGDYIESGVYHAELDQSSASDTIRVTGSTTLNDDSRLDLAEFGGLVGGSGAVLCGERWNIIDTPGVINGGWGEISDINNPGALGQTFQSQLLFDRGTGDLVSLGLTGDQTVADYTGISGAQANILTAVLNGATGNDLTLGNFNSQDGGTGTLLNAIYTVGQPGDKAPQYDAIDSLSPEGFAGAVDYALLATRNYVENAMSYRPRWRDSMDVITHDEKGGLLSTPIFRDDLPFETFAGYSHLNVESSSSQSGNDYALKSNGAYAGGRWRSTDDLSLGSFIAGDTGSVRTSNLQLDVQGLLVGTSFDYTPMGPDGPLRILGTASYANFEFQGQRQSLVGHYDVPEFDSNTFEVGLRAEYDLHDEDGLRITPALGLRHITSNTNGFTETGGPGALAVERQGHDASLLDLGVFVNYQKFGDPFGLHAELRWQHDFADAHRDVDATFAASAASFQVTAPGMSSDAFVFSIGSYYDFNERYRIGLHYRGERRRNADLLHSVNLRFMAGF